MTEASLQKENVATMNGMDFKGMAADQWCLGTVGSTWNTLSRK